MKDKKGASIVDAFQKVLDKSKGCKPNKIWADKGSEFYNNSFKKWLKYKKILRCIQYIMKENLLLLKDLLEH